MQKTIHFDEMWEQLSEYQRLHEECIHVCVQQVTVNPFSDSYLCIENEMEMGCYLDGWGIFCLAYNTDVIDCSSMNHNYDKQIVPLKKHMHCNCETNSPILCEVHEDPELYIEKICFSKRQGNGGYKYHK